MTSLCRAVAQASARRFLSRSIPIQSLSTNATYSRRRAASSTTTIAAKQQQAPPPVKKVVEEWPRPSTIPFQPKVANSVQLMGYIHNPIQFGEGPDGKYWAGTLITQEKGQTSDSTSFWIPLIFEGDLAHIATCHLKKDDHVHISGHLSADPVPLSVNEARVQVMVQSVNFVEGHPQKKDSSPTASMENDDDPASNPWRHLLNNPKQWCDYRSTKRNGLVKPKHPDFKIKAGRQSLWLTDAPEWVKSKLDELEFDVYVREAKVMKGEAKVMKGEAKVMKGEAKVMKGDQSWNDLVENPDKWWDNRADKKNPKSPDFKNKETGEALWLRGSPTWVLPKLPPVRTKPDGAFQKRETLLS